MTAPLAYDLKSAAAATSGAFGPEELRRAIKAGRLKAKRSGTAADGEPCGKYVIPHANLQAFLDGLADA